MEKVDHFFHNVAKLKALTRRIAPGSGPREKVVIEEWLPCRCQHCDMPAHWFRCRGEYTRGVAEKIVETYNRALERV